MASVLIIDRDQYLTNLLMAHLSMQGFEVQVAHRGEDGLAKAIQTKPDLIIVDAVLPDATGFQMCNQFRRNAETQSIPIIMMSGLAQYANQQQFAFERGVTELIPKPVKVIELGEMVGRYIGPKQAPQHTPPVKMENAPVTTTHSTPTTEKVPFNTSTDIHAALSDWLSKALTREEEKKKLQPPII